MAVTLPTLSNQFPNVIPRTPHSLTMFVDTVPIGHASWGYIDDGEWVEEGANGDYNIPGAGAVALNLAGKVLYFTLGKTIEAPRQTLASMREVLDAKDLVANPRGNLPVYKGHEPAEVDFKVYDTAATWTVVGVVVYVVSGVDADGNVRAVLSTNATGDGATTGLAVGRLVKGPANNDGYVRVHLT